MGKAHEISEVASRADSTAMATLWTREMEHGVLKWAEHVELTALVLVFTK